MTDNHTRQIFVNIAVEDLGRSMGFFRGLGFEFEPRFTGENAACLIIGEDAFVMLLTRPFFSGFTRREVCDTTELTEALLAITCGARVEVDEMVETALATGGRPTDMGPQDHGFMYGRSFYDPDGHHWEVIWMDPDARER